MSTTTQARTTKANAKTTTRNASTTAKSASTTAKTAADTAKSASATAQTATRQATATVRREADKAERGVTTHTRRVIEAAQAEVSAVAAKPTRPLFFALGVVDRTTAGVRAVPSTLTNRVVSTPQRYRDGIVSVFATAGDLAERAQRGYTDVTRDGEKLVRAIRRQESTQAAVKYADRAQTRASRSLSDAEKAVEAGAEAATEAVNKLG